MTTTTNIRVARTYWVQMRDESGFGEKVALQIDPGTEIDQDAAAVAAAEQAIRDWVSDGDWGSDGARVQVGYVLSDAEYVWPEEWIEVEIEPDHAALIRAASGDPQRESCGDDPDDHDWTAEGEGGCSENPGVFGHGGTTMSFSTHCRRCGLHRCVTALGSQRNPGDHDTVEYRWLSNDEIAAHVRDGEMEASIK